MRTCVLTVFGETNSAAAMSVVDDRWTSAARTRTYLAGPFADRMLGMLEGYGVPITPQVRELVTGTPASAIEHALGWIDDNGGSRGYLARAGVSDAALDAIAERLTAAG